MTKATYQRPQLKEYYGNPLLEALPPILNIEETLENLSVFPHFDEQERSHPNHLRQHYLDRIYDIVQAQPEHAMLATRISRLIRHGYKSRNPLLPEFLRRGHALSKTGLSDAVPLAGYARCRSVAYVTGLSGIGKSTAVERVLSEYPQVITHERYRDSPFAQTQVVWLNIDCPHDGSLKQFCLSFFAALDKALEGTEYFEQYTRRHSSLEALVNAMAKLMHVFHVGILAIDELNFLTCAPRGGETKLLNLLVSLVNKLGVPQLWIGTFESARLFTKTFRNARRVSVGGPFILDRYTATDPQWRLFIETLWHYQWIRKPTGLTDDFLAALYEASQGVTDIAVNVFMIAQENAITSGAEEFTCQDIAKIVSAQLSILQPALEALRRSDKKSYETFRELLPPQVEWRDASGALDQADQLRATIDRLIDQREQRLKSMNVEGPEITRQLADRSTKADAALRESNCPLAARHKSLITNSKLPTLEAKVLKVRRARA